VHVARVGPRGESGDDVELAEEIADDLVSIGFGTETIQLRHDAGQGLLHIADGALGVELALLIEATLTLGKFFAVEIGKGMEDGLADLRARVGQEARQPVP